MRFSYLGFICKLIITRLLKIVSMFAQVQSATESVGYRDKICAKIWLTCFNDFAKFAFVYWVIWSCKFLFILVDLTVEIACHIWRMEINVSWKYFFYIHLTQAHQFKVLSDSKGNQWAKNASFWTTAHKFRTWTIELAEKKVRKTLTALGWVGCKAEGYRYGTLK